MMLLLADWISHTMGNGNDRALTLSGEAESEELPDGSIAPIRPFSNPSYTAEKCLACRLGR